MKAAVLHSTGSIDTLTENLRVEEVPKPVAGDDEVIVKVRYASLNHRDLWISLGQYAKIQLPVILGSDCAGIIYARGKNTGGIDELDSVVINPSLNWGNNELHQSNDYSIIGMPDNGTFADFVKVKSSLVYRMPSHLSFAEASALPLAGLTAYRALFRKANVMSGENVLITGIGGGVATIAMQLAIAAGANVFVTSGSEKKISKAIDLGAKAGALYTDPEWWKKILSQSEKNIDVIIDGTGGNTMSALLEAVSYGGRIVLYGATLGRAENVNLYKVYWKQISLLGTTMGSSDDFSDMLRFVGERCITPVIDSAYDLEYIVTAFQRMQNSEQFGKIVLKI